MQREEKSERSRRQVLDAALHLFAHHGFRATSVREIAERAGVSIGNLYHHFADKEAIFKALLAELWEITESPRFPFRRALATGQFPDNLERLALAARDSILEFRDHVALVYVDVIEFEGTHIRKFYGDLANRFSDFLRQEGAEEAIRKRLRPGVAPVSALMLVTRIFFNYFTIEILFNVPEPFGKDSQAVVREIADMLRNGIAA
ncbi:MAG: TetR/AcrR family transcriptional regulator [Thermoanaerobaculia bacterium]|nr:TetR/AcrR family transcriptional regulator [Thermoanaerobaculia bacterium]